MSTLGVGVGDPGNHGNCRSEIETPTQRLRSDKALGRRDGLLSFRGDCLRAIAEDTTLDRPAPFWQNKLVAPLMAAHDIQRRIRKIMKCQYASLLLVILTVCGCVPLPARGIDDRSGSEILISIIKEGFPGHEVRFAEIGWPSHGGGDHFSRSTGFEVLDTTVKEAADQLQARLDALPAERGWTSHGSGRQGDELLQASYEENGDRHFLDFILRQAGEDVRVTVLYKGVAR